MGHDVFNASSTATWIECSYSALNAVPEPLKKASTIEAADAGTAQHENMEAGNVADVEAFLAQLEPGDEYRELRVKITDNCGGTLDILRNNSRIVTVLDGKFGKWDVAAFHNLQLLTYSAAVLPQTTAEWFRLVIFQPNGLDEEPFKQWVAHRSEVEPQRPQARPALPLVQCLSSVPGHVHRRRICYGRHVAPRRRPDNAGTGAAVAAYPCAGRRQVRVRRGFDNSS
jgi:hypothetical protein